MANPMDKRELEIRKKVGAILFTIAGLCFVAGIAIILMFPDSFKGGNTTNTPISPQTTATPQIRYEKVDLQTMLDELDKNALRAEETYQDMYVEITGEIKSFDSDGKYISIVPCGAPLLTDWTQCFLSEPTHKTFLLEKAVGDVVTIRGKVITIGEIIGYQVRIVEISE